MALIVTLSSEKKDIKVDAGLTFLLLYVSIHHHQLKNSDAKIKTHVSPDCQETVWSFSPKIFVIVHYPGAPNALKIKLPDPYDKQNCEWHTGTFNPIKRLKILNGFVKQYDFSVKKKLKNNNTKLLILQMNSHHNN